jgi:drug/metabolite transporter (DMT)-like permease
MLSVVMNTVSQLSLKRALIGLKPADRGNPASPTFLTRILKNPFLWIWIGLLLPSILLWLKAISSTELSFAYPFLSLNLVLISLGSVAFLKERMSASQWTGTALILFGLILISRS